DARRSQWAATCCLTTSRGGMAMGEPPSAISCSGEVAGHPAAFDFAERRLLGRARGLGERAPRAEPAAARHVARVGWLALQREVERDAAPADAWHRRQERARVGMARLLEDGGRVAQLDDPA